MTKRQQHSARRISSKGAAKLIRGPTEIRWRSVIARAEYVLEYSDRFCVVVRAHGNDPYAPNDQDVTNAKLTAVVFCRQIRYRFSAKGVSVYLKYANHTQREVDVDVRATTKIVRDYLENTNMHGSIHPLPSPVLAYLLNQLC